jgi:formylglycine-generating enzyme required for sulfatase activity
MDYNDAIALSVEGGPADEADPATVSGFRLDEYLVTVGRFRRFVRAWNGGSGLDGGPGYLPAAGSGKHTYLNGGLGLANSVIPGTYETGWVASDDAYVAPTDDNLACNALGLTPSRATWTSSAGGNETLPINCVLREEAYAFCIWDGGFLPSDAEWEYAAAGGSQQRKYPWGGADPGLGDAYAIYGGHYDGNTVAPVGTASPLGVARWGQVDLSGDVFEWNLDVSPSSFDPCTDCANLTHLRGGSGLVARGGSFYAASIFLVPSCQLAQLPLPGHRFEEMGFRCARAP